MKLQRWLTLSMTAFLIVGCTGRNVEQAPERAAQSPDAMASTAPASPLASPDVTEAAQTVERSGTFVSGEHPTRGAARLVTRNGQSSVELGQDFETSDLGPDLVVILHRSDDVIGSTQPPAYPINEGDYVILAPLKQFKGAQSYSVPDTVNLADYQSAGIWCRKFNAMFGAAVLRP